MYMHNRKKKREHFIYKSKALSEVEKCVQIVKFCFDIGESCQINYIYLETNSLVNL